MATSLSSCSPSSSAVTIPIPGKSILKRPPPTQTGIFNRIKGFLPTQPTTPISEDINKPLKRAHFILPQLAVIYPISSLNPPSTPTLKDEKRAIEERETERRKRIVRGNSIGPNETEEWWSLDKVESFYRECCASRDEEPDLTVSAAFKRASSTNPRSVDLSGVQLTPTAAAILSDVFNIEWGLRKLTLRECDLDEFKLKPMLHALLIPGTLVFLSVASNRRLKTPAFKIIGAYASKAKSLQFLDLSSTSLDKKAVEYIAACLTTAPEPGLVSLRLDDCALRPAALEALSRAVRTSSLRNISLRHNKITTTGAVALALMIRDYPDVVPGPPPSTPLSPSHPLSPPPASSGFLSPSPSFMSPPPSPHLPPPIRAGPVLPPPRHPSAMSPQTTYTPYIPRSKRGATTAHPPNPLSATGQPVPIITSNSQGGVTTRHAVPAPVGSSRADGANGVGAGGQGRHEDGPSAALLDKVRALDTLPRLGALRTLDLRGNDLRTGVSYLAQVLKRNRTLKVLNLSENKLDVQCLVSIAEALKYNLCLETLDLSRNPCSGPSLEGIQSLRTAFTLNTALKRLFLSSTHLTSSGAIALAEFLPESRSLLHLDLTLNALDIAGVLALSKGLKGNHVMRCLDLNIPPDDEEFARMCRDILGTCVRNTEEAERAASGGSPEGGNRGATPLSGKGLGKGVWGMIEESKLARSIRMGGGLKTDTISRAQSLLARIDDNRSPQAGSATSSGMSTPTAVASPTSADQDLIQNARDLVEELTAQIQSTTADASQLEQLLDLCDKLNGGIERVSTRASGRSLLHGLGLKIEGVNGSSPNGSVIHSSPTSLQASNSENGEAEAEDGEEEEEEEEVPTTPRVDKGKARAEPEPEEPEKVLSPTYLITESEDEDEDETRFGDGEEAVEVAGVASPTDRSKSWVEEEGEIFRKGTVLLGPEEMEGEYAGEDLRRELLEAMVERPPPRGIIDEFGMELSIQTPPLPLDEQGLLSPSLSSSSLASPMTSPLPGADEQPQAQKPPPRPYISRVRSTSSNSVIGVAAGDGGLASPVSPGVKSPTSPGGAGRGFSVRS
ncbi:hypothetical protein HYDPIDRAFT_31861 [Hydnomerulius pinastri MD-312]|uniref:RNI-like protein n=1 Tax=Hydnomerulius pinastri MD-312 TaxID=994086 RepID=A0A0C9VSF6_9AGAM|nr:hypothetical protein HYDPIDRAFT_31861 [Hydnomerulius pinastri MD-312]